MAAPFVAGVLLFSVLPLVVVIRATTEEWDLLGAPETVVLPNLLDGFTNPRFLHSLGITLALVALVVPIQTAAAVALAALLARSSLHAYIRPLLVFPWVISPIVVGIAWRWLVSPLDGPLAVVAGRQFDVTSSAVGAMATAAAVLIWNNVGYCSLFFSAALAVIPREIWEHAALDGAVGWKGWRFIVLPLLTPTIAFVVLTSVASTAATFDQVYGLTGGGPGTATEILGIRMYLDGFVVFDVRQSAVSAAAAFVCAIPVLFVMRRRMVGAR
jgi:multiple sugar transport system permease protein